MTAPLDVGRASAIALVLAAASATSSTARAEPPPLELDWQAPADCAVGKRVVADVARLAGAAAATGAPVHAVARVERRDKGYRVVLTTEQLGERGERAFEGATCAKVADAAALILSLMLAPVPSTETIAPDGIEAAVASAKRAPPEPAPAVDARRAERPTPRAAQADDGWGLAIGARAGGDLASVPEPTLFAGPDVWLARGPVRIGAGAAFWLPRTASGGPRAESGASVALVAGAVRTCLSPIRAKVVPEGCVGLEVGGARGEGQGIRRPTTSWAPWAAVLPAIAIRGTGALLPASVTVEVPLVLIRPAFGIDGFGEVFRASPVGLRVTLGATFELR